MKNYRFWSISICIATLLLIIVGFVAPDYQLDLLATALIYGLFAASVDFSYGYAGILNLGSAIYFGVGAYVMAYGLKHGINSFLLILIGIVVSEVISSIIGYVGFRVKASPIHFGLIGLAVALGFQQLSISLSGVTGGSNGITSVPRPDLFNTPSAYFWFVTIVVMVVLFILWRFVNSDFGRALKALRHDETKLETMGYNPLTVKMTVSSITAAVSSLAGALFVPISGISYPDLFGVTLSMSVLIWVALGGTGTLVGPFVLAIVLKLSESTLSTDFQESYMLIIGAIFVVMVIIAPEGVFGIGKRLTQKLKRKEISPTINKGSHANG